MAIAPDLTDFSRVPQHVAIIMDGNGRWAQSHGLQRLEGHAAGAQAVRRVVESCVNQQIKYLTLFSFSTENWERSQEEVSGLMKLFRQYLDSELSTLVKNGVRLRAIGDLEKLPFMVRTALHRNIEATRENKDLTLVLAISYGGREEIVYAAKRLAKQVQQGKIQPEEITSEVFSSTLWSGDIPDPDLLIRTGGEMRISNFLLWQLAYSEIVVTEEMWPDFNEEIFENCIKEYSFRQRRFGRTQQQIEESLRQIKC